MEENGKTRVLVANVYLIDLASKEEIRILGEMAFGRTQGDKTFPKDELMSKKHFRLVVTEDGVMIEDFGSTNITKVNGKALQPNSLHKLRSRDTLKFGKQQFQIVIGGQIEEDEKTRVATDLEAPAHAIALMEFTENNIEDNQESANSGILLARLATQKKCFWYMQIDGSEFGPLTFQEMQKTVEAPHFRNQAIFIFAEGLPNWTPISASHKIFGSKKEEERKEEGKEGPSLSVGGGPTKASLVATVACVYFSKIARKKVMATCESIGPTEISIKCEEKIEPSFAVFEIEVMPRNGAGISRFRANVMIAQEHKKRDGYLLAFQDLTPETKALIEKYMNSKK